jgi:hypothetical protein
MATGTSAVRGYADQELRQWLRAVLPGIGASPSVETLAASLSLQSAWGRRRLISRVEETLGNNSKGRSEEFRALLARTLTAALPESLAAIRRLLGTPPKRPMDEVHFSLFVALSDVLELTSREVRLRLLSMVATYLESTASNSGQSAWMAGDLLGDHWPIAEAVPVLRRLARSARFPAGREGVLHGLSHALERVPKAVQWEIVGVLRLTATEDRSTKVRAYARSIMGDLRGL